MNLRIRFSLLILLLSTHFSFSQQGKVVERFNHNPSLSSGNVDPEKGKSIDSLLQAFVDEQKLNAVTAFVAKGGNVLYHKAFGMKDIEKQIPASVDDYYVLFSQTKARSEEHTSELQSRPHLVCRLLLEKKNQKSVTVIR